MSTISEYRAVGHGLTGQDTQEERYLHLYLAYRKNQISEAQFKSETKALQVQAPDGQPLQLAENAVWYRFDNGQWLFHSYMTNGKNRRRLNRLAGYQKRKVCWPILASVLIFALLVAILIPGPLHRSIIAFLRPEPIFHSAEMKQELYPGLTLTAPEGALLREGQSFTAQELTDEKLYSLTVDHPCDLLPLYGFKIEGGMGLDDVFNKDIELDIDLTQTSIPEEVYPFLDVWRMGTFGAERVAATVEGQILHITASRISLFLVGIVKAAVLATAAGLAFAQAISNEAEYGGYLAPYREYTHYKFTEEKYNGYQIYYHDSLAPQGFNELKDREKAIMVKYGFIWDEAAQNYVWDSQSRPSKKPELEIRRAALDPEMIKLQTDRSRLPIPEALKILADQIRFAHDYLVDICGLRAPGAIIFIVLPTGAGDGILADESKAIGRTPIIKIGPDMLAFASLSAAERKLEEDNLQVTLTHEMFHALQHRYFSGSLQNLWFAEATAVLLEKDFVEYAVKKKIINGHIPTDTNYYHLLRHGTAVSLTEEQHRRMGYTLYHTLLYQRTHSLPAFGTLNKQNYLHQLMVQFQADDNANALYNLTGRSDTLLTDYFKANDQTILSDTLERSGVQVNQAMKNEPIMRLTERPLSIGRFDIQINPAGLAGVDLANSRLLLVLHDPADTTLQNTTSRILYSPDTTDALANRKWSELERKNGFCPLDAAYLANGLVTCVINEKAEFEASPAQYSVLLANKPEKAISVRYDKALMGFEVELPADAKTEASLKRGRAVEVTVPGTSIQTFRKYVRPGETKVFISVLEILSQGKTGGNQFQKWAGTLLTTAIKAGLRLNLTAVIKLNPTIFEAGQGALSIGINDSFTQTDEDGIQYKLADEMQKQGYPTSIDFQVNADEKIRLNLTGNSGMTINLSSRLTDYFTYYRFLFLSAKAGIDYDALAKKLPELDNADVTFSVRDVFSMNPVVSVDAAVACEDSLGKTQELLFGPASDKITLLTSGLTLDRKALPEGVYEGKLLLDIQNNILESVNAQRAIYRDRRILEQAERETERYIARNHPADDQIAAEKKRILEEVKQDDAAFDTDFKESMDEFNTYLGSIAYRLTITSQTTATISEISTSGTTGNSPEDQPEVFDCTITPTGQTGVYDLTVAFPDEPVTARLVLLPNGDIVTNAALAILTRQ